MKTLQRLFWLIVAVTFSLTAFVTIPIMGTSKIGKVFDFLIDKLK